MKELFNWGGSSGWTDYEGNPASEKEVSTYVNWVAKKRTSDKKRWLFEKKAKITKLTKKKFTKKQVEVLLKKHVFGCGAGGLYFEENYVEALVENKKLLDLAKSVRSDIGKGDGEQFVLKKTAINNNDEAELFFLKYLDMNLEDEDYGSMSSYPELCGSIGWDS